MKKIPDNELHARFVATKGALSHLITTTSHRRHTWKFDFHSMGDPFTRDYSVIQFSKAWRRMAVKNQVASAPDIPHARNRMTHVCEVEGHAARIADHLGLNVMLALSIAAGHDIGHVPYGHQGEYYLQQRSGVSSFTHEVMGVVIAQHIERGAGVGLNLTHATLDGMFRHSGKNVSPSMTQEAWVVRFADKIAYLFADFNDFDRLNWKSSSELKDLMNWFGHNQRDRSFRTIMALCEESKEEGRVCFETSEAGRNFDLLRKLMYDEYTKVVEQSVDRFLGPVYDFLEKSELIPPLLGVTLLTDEEVKRLGSERQLISSRHIMDTGLGEIITMNEKAKLFSVNVTNLDLDW